MSAPASSDNAEVLTSKDYYFDSYAHHGNIFSLDLGTREI